MDTRDLGGNVLSFFKPGREILMVETKTVTEYTSLVQLTALRREQEHIPLRTGTAPGDIISITFIHAFEERRELSLLQDSF